MKFDLFFNLNKNYMSYLGQRHYFHMVTPSPWPFLTAMNVFVMLLSAVVYMHNYLPDGGYMFILSLINLIFVVFLWFRDVIREGTFEGMHTKIVQKNLKFGFALFIITEIMFFFGFFWAFFHSSLSPAVEIGGIWPAVGIEPINPWKLPLLNTCLLLLSGIFITICHMFFRTGRSVEIFENFMYTLFCGLIFTLIQVYEYINASFTIADGIYGSTFYMLTGFHGLHVLVGSIFIFICLLRAIFGHFTRNHHVGFECAAWYWHFVDVVWLFLYIFVYIWGSWGFYSSAEYFMLGSAFWSWSPHELLSSHELFSPNEIISNINFININLNLKIISILSFGVLLVEFLVLNLYFYLLDVISSQIFVKKVTFLLLKQDLDELFLFVASLVSCAYVFMISYHKFYMLCVFYVYVSIFINDIFIEPNKVIRYFLMILDQKIINVFEHLYIAYKKFKKDHPFPSERDYLGREFDEFAKRHPVDVDPEDDNDPYENKTSWDHMRAYSRKHCRQVESTRQYYESLGDRNPYLIFQKKFEAFFGIKNDYDKLKYLAGWFVAFVILAWLMRPDHIPPALPYPEPPDYWVHPFILKWWTYIDPEEREYYKDSKEYSKTWKRP